MSFEQWLAENNYHSVRELKDNGASLDDVKELYSEFEQYCLDYGVVNYWWC